MCTAYELGKRGGSFPDQVKARAMKELLALVGIAIIRPTLPAPVLMPDGELRTMAWGFRRPVPGGKTKQLWLTIVNSREDKLQGKTWSKAFRERRCLIRPPRSTNGRTARQVRSRSGSSGPATSGF